MTIDGVAHDSNRADRFMNNIRTNTILRQESRIKPITGNPHNTGNSIAINAMYALSSTWR